MTPTILIAQLIQIGIAAMEGVLKAQELAARSDLPPEEKEALLQADINTMKARLTAASENLHTQ